MRAHPNQIPEPENFQTLQLARSEKRKAQKPLLDAEKPEPYVSLLELADSLTELALAFAPELEVAEKQSLLGKRTPFGKDFLKHLKEMLEGKLASPK